MHGSVNIFKSLKLGLSRSPGKRVGGMGREGQCWCYSLRWRMWRKNTQKDVNKGCRKRTC